MANHLQGTLTHSVYEEFTKISTYCILTKQKTEQNTHQKGQRYNLPSVIQRINKENKQREIKRICFLLQCFHHQQSPNWNIFAPTEPNIVPQAWASEIQFWILSPDPLNIKYYIHYYPDIVQTSANAQHHWKTEHHLGRWSRSELPVYARHEVSAFLFFHPFYVSHPGLGRISASVITTHKKISITADDCRAQSLPRPGSSLCF